MAHDCGGIIGRIKTERKAGGKLGERSPQDAGELKIKCNPGVFRPEEEVPDQINRRHHQKGQAGKGQAVPDGFPKIFPVAEDDQADHCQKGETDLVGQQADGENDQAEPEVFCLSGNQPAAKKKCAEKHFRGQDLHQTVKPADGILIGAGLEHQRDQQHPQTGTGERNTVFPQHFAEDQLIDQDRQDDERFIKRNIFNVEKEIIMLSQYPWSKSLIAFVQLI